MDRTPPASISRKPEARRPSRGDCTGWPARSAPSVAARGTAFAAERVTLGRVGADGGLGSPGEWTTCVAVTVGDVVGELVAVTVGWVVVEELLEVVLEPLAVAVGWVVVEELLEVVLEVVLEPLGETVGPVVVDVVVVGGGV
jgi:hypothetical protein